MQRDLARFAVSTGLTASLLLAATSCCRPCNAPNRPHGDACTAEQAARYLDDARRHLEAWGTMTMGAPMVSVSNKPFEFDPKVTAEELFDAKRTEGSLRVARASSVRAGASVDLKPELGEDEDRTDAPDGSKDNAAAADVEKSSTAAIGQFSGEIGTAPRVAIRQAAGDHFELSLHKFLSKPEHLDPDYRIIYMVLDVSCIPGWKTREGFRGRVEASIEYDYGDSAADAPGDRFPQVIALYPQMESQVLDLRSSARSLRAIGLALAAAGNTVGASAFLDAATRAESDSQTTSDFTVSSGYTNGGRHFGFTFEPKFAAQDRRSSSAPTPGEFQQSITFPAVAIVAVHKRDYEEGIWARAEGRARAYLPAVARSVVTQGDLLKQLAAAAAQGQPVLATLTAQSVGELLTQQKPGNPRHEAERGEPHPISSEPDATSLSNEVSRLHAITKLEVQPLNLNDESINRLVADKLTLDPITAEEFQAILPPETLVNIADSADDLRSFIIELESKIAQGSAPRKLGDVTIRVRVREPLELANRIARLLNDRMLWFRDLGLRLRVNRFWSPVGDTTPVSIDFVSDRESEVELYSLAQRLSAAETLAMSSAECGDCRKLRSAGSPPPRDCRACGSLAAAKPSRANNELLSRVRSANAELFNNDTAIRLPNGLFNPTAEFSVASVEPASGFAGSGAVFIIRGANLANAKVELIDGATGQAPANISVKPPVASKTALAVMLDATNLPAPVKGLSFKVTVGTQTAFTPPIRFDATPDRLPATLEVQRDAAGHITRITLPPAMVPPGGTPHAEVAAYLKALLEELRVDRAEPATGKADISIDVKAEQKP